MSWAVAPVMVAFVVLQLAQPAAATMVVQLGLSPPPAGCSADAAACAVSASTEEPAPDGPLVAGAVGILVLGLAFGRRKLILPQVVS